MSRKWSKCSVVLHGARPAGQLWELTQMNHLLSGIAVAALAATFALGCAQTSAANQQVAASTPEADSTSAAPPQHRHARTDSHAAAQHGKPSHHPSRFPNLQGNVANQLNQAELARLQSGGSMTPPPEPASAPARGTQLQGPRPSSGR